MLNSLSNNTSAHFGSLKVQYYEQLSSGRTNITSLQNKEKLIKKGITTKHLGDFGNKNYLLCITDSPISSGQQVGPLNLKLFEEKDGLPSSRVATIIKPKDITRWLIKAINAHDEK